MSFMPNPGSIVLLKDGRVGTIVRVTPSGKDDLISLYGVRRPVTAWDIVRVIDEPDSNTESKS